jgi:formylmethanofuran dehydrogenase subunit E-like metal-binding protein
MPRRSKKLNVLLAGIMMLTVALAFVAATGPTASACQGAESEYRAWKSVGQKAASEALAMIMKNAKRFPDPKNLIALSNAGYAEVQDQTTMAAMDGVSEVTKVSRGANTLVEVHSAPRAPLWFAIFDKKSGYCAYLQLDPDRLGVKGKDCDLFKIRSIAKIDADYLFKTSTYVPATGNTPAVYTDKFPVSPTFGGNEFRIVTIANGVAVGVPAYILRSFEFHDHYCPGVTSGIIMANFAKAYFTATETESWFVQGLQPWCKEDALQVMLNATPGKSGYGVTYSTAPYRVANWTYPTADAQNAASIIYHMNAGDSQWEGVVLGFTFPSGDTTGCGVYTGNLNKLCTDLWSLSHLSDQSMLTVIHRFKLPAGKHPKDYAAPGMDVMIKLSGFEAIP